MNYSPPQKFEQYGSLSSEAKDELRAVIQAQIIDCLNRFYAMETGMWGGPLSALMIRTVIKGQYEGKLYDLSALAAALDLPVTSVHRKARDLVKEGYLQRLPRGKSVYLAPTEKTCVTFDKSFDDMISALQLLYRRTGDKRS
jgi:DNA-binding MarR family transcriptional regulator